LPVIFANLFPGADTDALDDLHGETLDVICRRRRRSRGHLLSRTVAETLRDLHAAGHALCVASNGRTRYVETVIATYGVADLFLPRVTAGRRRRQDRHPPPLPHGRYPRSAAHGDGRRPRQRRRRRPRRRLPFIGCDYGHGHRQEIEHAGPLVQDFAALRAVIASLLA
jgi:phosphoglycolate phosphatase-like HAD superfamily hydrolase